jgi:hypothetical protein
MSLKSKLLVAISLILLFILLGSAYRWNQIRNIENAEKTLQTERILKEIADGFSRNDKIIIMKWAKAEYSDGWGNPIALSYSGNQGYIFISKGADGERGTDDDISLFVEKPK